jgi:predicted nucleic acid-binding protein
MPSAGSQQAVSRQAAQHRTVVLDAEGLAGIARRERRAWELLHGALENDQRVIVPASVLVEVMSGRPADAAVWHVVRRLPVHDIDASTAARAGALRDRVVDVRRKKRDLSLDALVVATAAAYEPAVVVSSDPGDMALLAQGLNITVAPL